MFFFRVTACGTAPRSAAWCTFFLLRRFEIGAFLSSGGKVNPKFQFLSHPVGMIPGAGEGNVSGVFYRSMLYFFSFAA